jgi:hypothetical protein
MRSQRFTLTLRGGIETARAIAASPSFVLIASQRIGTHVAFEPYESTRTETLFTP